MYRNCNFPPKGLRYYIYEGIEFSLRRREVYRHVSIPAEEITTIPDDMGNVCTSKGNLQHQLVGA